MHKFERNLPTTETEEFSLDPLSGKEVFTKIKTAIDPDKLVSTKDEFELTYLRWRYFMRAANPPAELIKQYEKAAYKVAKESYNDSLETMKISGLEIDDVCNIALVHLVSYLGCYSLQFSESGKLKVQEKRKSQEYSEEEVKQKDLSNMMIFIQQRMKDLVRVFRQKNKNVFGETSIAALFQLIDNEIPCTDLELIRAPDRYGYRRVTPSQYKELKRKLGHYPQNGRFKHNEIAYRYVHIHNTPVWISDHENSDDISVFNPQADVISQEYNFELTQRYKMESLLDTYQSATPQKKIKLLKKAIVFFKKKGMAKELALANRLLNKVNHIEGHE